MKTINSQIRKLFVIGTFTLVLSSCKKNDANREVDTKTIVQKAAIINNVKARYGNASASSIYNINKAADQVFYENSKGEKVPLYKTGNQPSTYNCEYTCGNTNDPGNLHIIYLLQSLQRIYMCDGSTNSDLIATWIITVPFTPLTEDPNNSSNKSYGSIKIESSLATNTWDNINSITIKNLGADPDCSTNNRYQISYRAANIPEDYFVGISELGADLRLYNDCSITGYVTTPSEVIVPESYLILLNEPCERVDQAYILPPGGGSTYATVTGNYVICSYPSSNFTPITYHEVEYRAVTSGSSDEWDDQTSTVHWGVPIGSGSESPVVNPSTGVSNLIGMTASSGDWLVRYRNVKTSVCDIIYLHVGLSLLPNGAWGNPTYWVVEKWSL